MFCWPCITVYQYNETNMMHFSFNLLRIKGLYMFRALLAHPQEGLHKRHLVYCMHTKSVGCGMVAVKLTLYACSIPNAVYAVPPEDKQVMLKTCRGPWFSIDWMKSASRWFHYNDILTISLLMLTPHFLSNDSSTSSHCSNVPSSLKSSYSTLKNSISNPFCF
jgi:hypothetical protein